MGSLTEQIQAEFAADERNPALAVNPGDIPINYDRITPEWLTHILCAGHPGAQVTSHRLDEPDDGTGNRQRIFLTYNDAGTQAGLPPSVFCKASEKLVNRIVMGTCGLIEGETAFYNRFSQLLDIEVPRCFLATYNPRSFNSIIMLEDLSLRGASFCDHRTVATREMAESQMRLLARVHGTFYPGNQAHALISTLPTTEKVVENASVWFNLEKGSVTPGATTAGTCRRRWSG